MVGHPKHVPKALEAGVDLICAQAGEGGGHTGDVPASILIPACVDAVRGHASPLTGKPVYVVGAGDLGTDAEELDEALTEIFQVASTWGAIVLIDEADVFLEERSLHDLERNAMVAVFLRQLEYYRGILFLTTNR